MRDFDLGPEAHQDLLMKDLIQRQRAQIKSDQIDPNQINPLNLYPKQNDVYLAPEHTTDSIKSQDKISSHSLNHQDLNSLLESQENLKSTISLLSPIKSLECICDDMSKRFLIRQLALSYTCPKHGQVSIDSRPFPINKLNYTLDDSKTEHKKFMAPSTLR